MIKLLISFLLLFFIFSCKEIKKENINSKLNDGIKKIEKIIEKKQDKLDYKNEMIARQSIIQIIGTI